MGYKRTLVIQDISCVGQCSMTVALPILSACGHETCILPTALLSTHTGGFGKPEVIHFDEALNRIVEHWKKNEILFDAILVGYLGTVPAVRTAGQIMDELLAPGESPSWTQLLQIMESGIPALRKSMPGRWRTYAAGQISSCPM